VTMPDEPTSPAPDELDPDFFEQFVGDELPTAAATPDAKFRVPVELEDDTRPQIRLGADVHRVTDEIAAALRNDPDLYKRAGVLAHVIPANDEEERRIRGLDKGTLVGSPIIRPMPLSMLVNRVSKHAACLRKQKVDEGDALDGGPLYRWVVDKPPIASVKAVHELGAWPGIRELRGILEAPSMRPDGSILQAPGYDNRTGYVYEPNAEFPPIPDRPSHSDCVIAFRRLAEPFDEFPYVSPAHLAAVLAAILTLIARPAIQGATPAWVFDASASRSGKSLQVDVIHIIATGRPASRMTFPENDEELEKVLAGYAMRGSVSANFDNIARKFGGAPLDKVITATSTVDLRVLGATDLRTFDWLAVVFGSGNNVEFSGDMLPRVLSPRIESKLENPETFVPRIADLRSYVRDRRVELVVAALTILRGYIVSGAEEQPGIARWGGFEAWSRLIPHALVWVGAHDPMGARRGGTTDEDPERVALSVLIQAWERLAERADLPKAGLTLKGALALLYPTKHPGEERPPDGFEDMREAVEALTDSKPGHMPSAERLGKVLRRAKGRPIAGRRFMTSTASGKVMRWRVVSS